MAAAKRKAVIELSLDAKKMDSGLVAARKKLTAFSSNVGKKLVSGMKSVGSALGGGFGIQGASMRLVWTPRLRMTSLYSRRWMRPKMR